ncbi:TIR domain-containing protein [Candidatus Protofrankia californiensis]|uniref:TIR domain-containing protein n=1 Tax=Candidatus Protofrankia californiensis TaxID=1839754 RepID=UPI001041B26D|nr:TIR domain-containing protein [Candidatus Protofrankia californiensis]
MRNEKRDEVKIDLDEPTLERQFIRPYMAGEPITVNGRAINIDQVERIRISHSPGPASSFYEVIRQKDAESQFLALGGPSKEWRAAAIADDVTDEYISGPPGTVGIQDATKAAAENVGGVVDERAVFLIHGRNSAAVEGMRVLLGALDLKPIEWDQAQAATGKASPYVGEILDAGFSLAKSALVFATPDDLVALHPALRAANEPPERLSGQPRPNVIFEAGMAWERFRARTVIVEYGRLRGFSDLGGVFTLQFDGSPQTRRSLASRLKTAGNKVDDSGTRWLDAGDFPPDLPPFSPGDIGITTSPPSVTYARSSPEQENALKGIPLRWILLARLAEMYRDQANDSHVLELDVDGLAVEVGVEVDQVKAVLSEMIAEGLVEGFAETFGRTATSGACRITGTGLRRLRAEA